MSSFPFGVDVGAFLAGEEVRQRRQSVVDREAATWMARLQERTPHALPMGPRVTVGLVAGHLSELEIGWHPGSLFPPTWGGLDIGGGLRSVLSRCGDVDIAEIGPVPRYDGDRLVGYLPDHAWVLIGNYLAFDFMILQRAHVADITSRSGSGGLQSDHLSIPSDGGLIQRASFCGHTILTRIVGEATTQQYGCSPIGQAHVFATLQWAMHVWRSPAGFGLIELLKLKMRGTAQLGPDGDFVNDGFEQYTRFWGWAAAPDEAYETEYDLGAASSISGGGCSVAFQYGAAAQDALAALSTLPPVAEEHDGSWPGGTWVDAAHALRLLASSDIWRGAGTWLHGVCTEAPLCGHPTTRRPDPEDTDIPEDLGSAP